MEYKNNTSDPFFTPEPIDPKDVARIQRLSGQQIEQMEKQHIARITHDFDERYARMIVEKGNSPAEEKKLLVALRTAFDTMHIIGWVGNEADYDKDLPSYFGEWDFKIAIDGGISEGEDALLPSEVNPTPAPTLGEMLSEEGLLKDWMNESTRKFIEQLCEAKEDAEKMLQQIKALRDGSLTRMQKKLETMQSKLAEAEATNIALRGDLNDVIKWRKDWENIKQTILKAYDPADVAEAGGLSDPEAMEIAVEAIMGEHTWEKELKEENAKLLANQDAWRESKEYLDEKQKWEKDRKQRIEADKVKDALIAYAKEYSGDETQLKYLALFFNEKLKGTAWEAVAENFHDDVVEAYRTADNKRRSAFTLNTDKVEIKDTKIDGSMFGVTGNNKVEIGK